MSRKSHTRWKATAKNLATDKVIETGWLGRGVGAMFRIAGRPETQTQDFKELILETQPYGNAARECILMEFFGCEEKQRYRAMNPAGIQIVASHDIDVVGRRVELFYKAKPPLSGWKLDVNKRHYLEKQEEKKRAEAARIEAQKRAMIEREKRRILAEREEAKCRAEEVKRRVEELRKVGDTYGSW